MPTNVLDRSASDIVLIVDDVPDNLSLLHDALDEAGYTVLVATNGESALARRLLEDYFALGANAVPPRLAEWIRAIAGAAAEAPEMPPLSVAQGAKRLLFSLQGRTAEGDWLLLLREESDAAILEAITSAFRLTPREAEVLFWVIKGKTNRDIGDILGTSPRTVNKHLEHVFEKLGVETRTAAATVAMNKVRAVQGESA